MNLDPTQAESIQPNFKESGSPGRRIAEVDWSKVDPELAQAARGFEAIFLDTLLRTMRQTVPKGDPDASSPATEIYQSMYDSEVAQKAAKVGGVGLAEQIVAYMTADRYTGNTGQKPTK